MDGHFMRWLCLSLGWNILQRSCLHNPMSRHHLVVLQVDPELVDSHFLRPHDHTIRATDLPERLQLLGKSVLEVSEFNSEQPLSL